MVAFDVLFITSGYLLFRGMWWVTINRDSNQIRN